MDAQDSSVIDVPHLKLAKVGKDRERRRGGAGWLGGRGAGSGFRGALGGMGAGAGGLGGGAGAGGFMGTGLSLAKLLLTLLVAGGATAGAWELGNTLAASTRVAVKPAAPKIFADKGPQKYADTSGVIKQENKIPNSLGYINNDGLTDEQRAAKKAAEDAAASKAAEDAQRQAAEDAQKQAAAAAKAAPAPDPNAAGAARDMAGGKLAPASFGSFGSAGAGGSHSSAGAAGGAGGNSGAAGAGAKGQSGAISAMSSHAQAATTRAAMASHGRSNAREFGKLQMASALSRQALSGGNETSAAAAAVPFDNNPSQGTAISGAGAGSGAQPGTSHGGGLADQSGGGLSNQSPGNTGNTGGPLTGDQPCSQPTYVRATSGPNSGTCEPPTAPAAKDVTPPYQWMLDWVPKLLAGITAALFLAFMAARSPFPPAAIGFMAAAAALGGVLAGFGADIAIQYHQVLLGGILSASGAGVAVLSIASLLTPIATPLFILGAGAALAGAALSDMALSSKNGSLIGAMM